MPDPTSPDWIDGYTTAVAENCFEVEAEIRRLREGWDGWQRQALAAEAERDRLREALQAISDRGDFEPFDDRCAPILIAIAREALSRPEGQA